jgi:hypothetical protein
MILRFDKGNVVDLDTVRLQKKLKERDAGMTPLEIAQRDAQYNDQHEPWDDRDDA